MAERRVDNDVVAGLVLAGFGAWFCGLSLLTLKFGTAFRMGSGFFPTVVGGMLLALGLLIAFLAWRSDKPPSTIHAEPLGPVPWRAVILLALGPILFGFAMRPLGLLPALLALCFMAAMAAGKMSFLRAVIISVAMTALCVGIFSFGLGVSLPLIGDWLR